MITWSSAVSACPRIGELGRVISILRPSNIIETGEYDGGCWIMVYGLYGMYAYHRNHKSFTDSYQLLAGKP